MINLLPPATKKQIAAARTNRILLLYNIILSAAVVFLVLAVGVIGFYLRNARITAESTVAENISRAGDFATVEADANSFRQNLASAKQILDNDVMYTKAILKFANVLPPGVTLDTLSLDSTTFGTPTTLTANVRDYNTVILLKNSLQSSDLFSDVSIQTISTGGSDEYPITATYSITISKDAAK
jgi:Tfp pilus assembly protein PilN